MSDCLCTLAQLLNWHKRRAARNRSPVLYRIAPQCSSAPLYLVPKVVQQSSLAALDTRGAFILQTQEETVIWQVRPHTHLQQHCLLAWVPQPDRN